MLIQLSIPVLCALSPFVQYVHKAQLASGRACAPQLHFPWLNVFPERVPYALAMSLSQLPSSGVSDITDIYREKHPQQDKMKSGKKGKKKNQNILNESDIS